MRRLAARTVILAAVVGVVCAGGGCAEKLGPHDRTPAAGLARADAYNEAVRRCGSPQIHQAEGTDGDNPSDYICTGP